MTPAVKKIVFVPFDLKERTNNLFPSDYFSRTFTYKRFAKFKAVFRSL